MATGEASLTSLQPWGAVGLSLAGAVSSAASTTPPALRNPPISNPSSNSSLSTPSAGRSSVPVCPPLPFGGVPGFRADFQVSEFLVVACGHVAARAKRPGHAGHAVIAWEDHLKLPVRAAGWSNGMRPFVRQPNNLDKRSNKQRPGRRGQRQCYASASLGGSIDQAVRLSPNLSIRVLCTKRVSL